MEPVTDEQLKHVWGILDKMEAGSIITIVEHAPRRPDLFVVCCKMYFMCYENILFSDDYSRLKKL